VKCPTKSKDQGSEERPSKRVKYTDATLEGAILKSNGVKSMPRRPSAPTNVKPSQDSSLHVLVVEDNLINQKVMMNQLRRAGCTVHVANHGGEALTFLKRTEWYSKPKGEVSQESTSSENIPLSVVLLDLEMPVMDGLTCIGKIREMQGRGEFTGHLPVIAVTANARNEQMENALKSGMVSSGHVYFFELLC